MTSIEAHTRDVLSLIDSVRRSDRHTLIGIAGPPGSGKSTLAAAVVERLNARHDPASAAQLVPMDGFHLDNSVLDANGLRAVKGAPETFDVAGFVALVGELRQGGADILYPLFDRAADRTVPAGGCVPAGPRIAVVEGNYLLLRDDGWAALKPLFDATVMIAPPLDVLERRLMARWRHYGLPPEEARRKVLGNDLVNARRVLDTSARADITLDDTDDPSSPPAPDT